jgi:hypothetical protein
MMSVVMKITMRLTTTHRVRRCVTYTLFNGTMTVHSLLFSPQCMIELHCTLGYDRFFMNFS